MYIEMRGVNIPCIIATQKIEEDEVLNREADLRYLAISRQITKGHLKGRTIENATGELKRIKDDSVRYLNQI
jgi:hypothetical protein